MSAMSDAEMREMIRNYIAETTYNETGVIKDDTLLFDEGIFDSMGLLLFIEFIKEKFGVDTSDEELIIENFESVNSIIDYIKSKKNS